MTFIENELGEQHDICDVCQIPLSDNSPCFTKEYEGILFTFCSEKCFKEYLESPELYVSFPDDEVIE
ncbi:MAG: hypothetical protein UU08_C0009G0011 [Candidatus Uhrbacteria bacterium GW2011_GWE2_40_58]|nr:MAG: hypothetical protein UT94_C0017G0014 [Candidatus Uhrbacteria bacterium GW2011_GWF2_40_263]KKR67749.1 MAG: hypothetical protein UU08_C0009G0011 [Candidatus Uhrbacteria bacterium GW2011_GWE2_40_58]OGL92190.1 MAG: hypothetical protein A2239_02975 [Candidatus Uhrbacteria bacterium RIFOXYA2_FULL_40_9]OGL96725.1 MAG: hypothetical protein A2332_00395 [Candidatus Uhrbacteria bacterium RIFOXYB2_FULL_41_18]HBK35302.1 hypothetical protein [Candidatus Uhrbacteria bacterium]